MSGHIDRDQGQRLQKVLAAAGTASRRKCEQLIRDGRVRVNGMVVESLPVFADPQKDRITVDGRVVRAQSPVYYLLNKPRGVICTSSDPQGRKKAVDLVKSDRRLVCAGRLDADTTGIIILTNDNELINHLTHPRYGLPKTYVVRVKGTADAQRVERLSKGVWLAEGRTNKSLVKVIKRGPTESLLEITVKQGLNRQIRRMILGVGLSVKALRRTGIGRITDHGLGTGRYRPLSTAEVTYLKRATRRGVVSAPKE